MKAIALAVLTFCSLQRLHAEELYLTLLNTANAYLTMYNESRSADAEEFSTKLDYWKDLISSLSEMEQNNKIVYLKADIEIGLKIFINNISSKLVEEHSSGFATPIPTLPKQPGTHTPTKELKEGVIIPSLVNYDVGYGKNLKLRPHQIRAWNQIAAVMDLERQLQEKLGIESKKPEGGGVNVVVMPVGGGKTRLMVASIALQIEKGGYKDGDKIIVMCHTDSIHSQNLREIERVSWYFKKIIGRNPRITSYKGQVKDLSGDIIVLSIPTVATETARQAFLSSINGNIKAIMIDEVHHLGLSRSYEGSWYKVLEGLRNKAENAFEIGFTATPVAGDPVRVKITERELMKSRVTPRTFLVKVEGTDLNNLRVGKNAEDFSERQLSNELLKHGTRNKNIFKSIEATGIKQADGRYEGILFFGTDLAHIRMMSKDFAEYFYTSKGKKLVVLGGGRSTGTINKREYDQAVEMLRRGEIHSIAANITGNTSQEMINLILEGVNRGEVEAVFSVNKFLEGSDLYMFTHQVGGRPTLSWRLKWQERGRVNRRAQDEVTDDGRLVKDRPKILYDVIDRFNRLGHNLIQYYNNMGVMGFSVIGNNQLFDCITETTVESAKAPYPDESRIAEADERHHREIKRDLAKRLESIEAVGQELIKVLNEHYGGDEERLSRNLGMSMEEVLNMLKDNTGNWKINIFLRRLATLLYQKDRNRFVKAYNLSVIVGKEHIIKDPSHISILKKIVKEYESSTGGPLKGTARVNRIIDGRNYERKIYEHTVELLGKEYIGEKSCANLISALLVHYWDNEVQREKIIDFIYELRKWDKADEAGSIGALRRELRRYLALEYGGILEFNPKELGRKNISNSHPLRKFIAAQSIQQGSRPVVLYETILAFLPDKEKTKEMVIDAVYEEQKWDKADETGSIGELRRELRRFVALQYGGVLESNTKELRGKRIDDSNPLKGFIAGQSIQHKGSRPGMTYKNILALLPDKEKTKEMIIDAVYEEQKWDKVDETGSIGALRRELRRFVALEHGGSGKYVNDSQSLKRFIDGQSIKLGSYHGVLHTAILVFLPDKEKTKEMVIDAVYEEQKWDKVDETGSIGVLRRELRRFVALEYGGAIRRIPKELGGKHLDTLNLKVFMSGKKIQHKASGTPKVLYDHIQALIQDKERVREMIIAAVYEEQKWDKVDETGPFGEIRRELRRHVALEYGGVLAIFPKELEGKQISRSGPLNRFIGGENFPITDMLKKDIQSLLSASQYCTLERNEIEEALRSEFRNSDEK